MDKFEDNQTCKLCEEWTRNTFSNDGHDFGFCKFFKKLTCENYDCSIEYQFLNDIGPNHTTDCKECDFNCNNEICQAKRILGKEGWRILSKQSCPIRQIYRYVDKTMGGEG